MSENEEKNINGIKINPKKNQEFHLVVKFSCIPIEEKRRLLWEVFDLLLADNK